MTQAAVTEPVPSVLPEGGIDLLAELERYRAWLIEQAMLRSAGNISAAARLLGFRGSAALYKLLARRAQGLGFRRGCAARLDPSAHLPPQPLPTELAEALPVAEVPAPAAERELAKLMARIPWERVEQLRAEGAADWTIAKRLAPSLDTHRFSVEKALKARREEGQA